jgi:hypothetical protein
MYQTFVVTILFFALLRLAHASPLLIRCSNVTTKWGQQQERFNVSVSSHACETILPAPRGTQYVYAEKTWRSEWHIFAQQLLRQPEPLGSTTLVMLSVGDSRRDNFTALSSFYTSSLRDVEFRATLAECGPGFGQTTCKTCGSCEGLVACIDSIWSLAEDFKGGGVVLLF